MATTVQEGVAMSDFGRRTREFKRLSAIVYSWGRPCIICGQPIDYRLPYRDPYTGEVNRQSKSIQHILSVTEYPHLAETLSNLAAAHLQCNWELGTTTTTPAQQLGTPSEDW